LIYLNIPFTAKGTHYPRPTPAARTLKACSSNAGGADSAYIYRCLEAFRRLALTSALAYCIAASFTVFLPQHAAPRSPPLCPFTAQNTLFLSHSHAESGLHGAKSAAKVQLFRHSTI